jgi:hypothetical protein
VSLIIQALYHLPMDALSKLTDFLIQINIIGSLFGGRPTIGRCSLRRRARFTRQSGGLESIFDNF